ncbi:unnamed protein product [Calypogeia fissa]
MAGIIMQERILGLTLGLAGGLAALIYEQKNLWRSTRAVADVYSGGRLPPSEVHQVPEPIFGRKAQEQLIHAWNSGVDNTLGRVVAALSLRGW